MSLDDKIQQLDETIASRFRDWVKDLHEQLGRSLNDQIAKQLEAASSEIPARLMDSDLEAFRAAVSSAGQPGALHQLHEATIAIDRAGKQAEILDALLEGGSHFASRLALFLTRKDQASGWAGRGFGAADASISGLVVEYRDDGPWDRLSQGRTSIRLGAAECGRLCSRIEASLPEEGLLIPLVLRDSVAAALYADRVQDDSKPFDPKGLQILAYLAAQAIENLPFRKRTSTTPTLVLDEDSGQEGLGLWDAAPAAAAPSAPAGDLAARDEEVEEARAEEPVEEVEEEAAEDSPAAEDFDAAGAADEAEEEFQLADEADEAEEEVDPALETASLQGGPVIAEEPATFEQPAVSGPSIPWQEEPAPVTEEEDDSWAVEVTPEEDESAEPAALWEAEEAEEEVALEVEADEPPAEEESAALSPPAAGPSDGAPLQEQSVASQLSSGLETIQTPTMPPGMEGLEEDATMLLPGSAGTPSGPPAPSEEGEDATMLLSSSAPPPVAPPAPAAPAQGEESDETHPGADASSPASAVAPPGAPPKQGRASEVKPPEDVDGPGWAFSKEEAPVADEDEDHKQAKRLARLLVSEIKLYNEEQVEQGQKNNNIYERLKEDIDRSRQVYEDRVNERVRSTNDYFYQELVRTLASGDAQALGI